MCDILLTPERHRGVQLEIWFLAYNIKHKTARDVPKSVLLLCFNIKYSCNFGESIFMLAPGHRCIYWYKSRQSRSPRGVYVMRIFFNHGKQTWQLSPTDVWWRRAPGDFNDRRFIGPKLLWPRIRGVLCVLYEMFRAICCLISFVVSAKCAAVVFMAFGLR